MNTQKNNPKPNKNKTIKHDAYQKPAFDAYAVSEKQQVSVDIKQQGQLFNQFLRSIPDNFLQADGIAKTEKIKTTSIIAQQAMQQDEQQRQIANVASHLASHFTQQHFSVEMPTLGRLNIKVDMQEAKKQLAFCIETSDNQSRTWLNEHQASIGKAFHAQTGWQASIEVI